MSTLNHETVPLRQAMVDELRALGGIRSEPVAAAFSAVPRHLFAPAEPLDRAYAANVSVWPSHNEDGHLTSTVSAAHIQAVQLEQAGVRPGMRVLEIGSGGYNAALLAELVGPEGEVTSIDIDPAIIARARTCLDTAGYAYVRTVLADGDRGLPAHAPFDRIVVTARSWDIPPAWIEQLAPGGRIVVPLRMRCLTRTVAFDRIGDAGVRLEGNDVRLCSFVPMQGAGAHDEYVVTITQTRSGGPHGNDDSVQNKIHVRTDSVGADDLAATAEAIGRAASSEPTIVWTGVEFDHVDDLDLWLGLHLHRFAILTADRELTDIGSQTAITKVGAPTLIAEGGFAYRIKRPIPSTDRFETGVIAWGVDAVDLASAYADAVRGWSRYRIAGGRGPRIVVHPAGALVTPAAEERLIAKSRTQMVVSWPHS